MRFSVLVAAMLLGVALGGCGLSAAAASPSSAAGHDQHSAAPAHHAHHRTKTPEPTAPIVPSVSTATAPPVPQPVVTVVGTPSAGSTVVLQVSHVPSGYVLVSLAMNEGPNTVSTPIASAQSNAQSTATSGFSVSPDGAVIRFAFDMAMGGGQGQFVLTYQNSAGKRLTVHSHSFAVQG